MWKVPFFFLLNLLEKFGKQFNMQHSIQYSFENNALLFLSLWLCVLQVPAAESSGTETVNELVIFHVYNSKSWVIFDQLYIENTCQQLETKTNVLPAKITKVIKNMHNI